MKFFILLIFLEILPTFAFANPEYEEGLRKYEEFRDDEIERFILNISSNIENTFEQINDGFTINDGFYTNRDIFMQQDESHCPGNFLLENMVREWALLYESLPANIRYIIPSSIVLYFENYDAGFFSYDFNEQRWKMLTSEKAEKFIAKKLSETYIKNFYHAPAA